LSSTLTSSLSQFGLGPVRATAAIVDQHLLVAEAERRRPVLMRQNQRLADRHQSRRGGAREHGADFGRHFGRDDLVGVERKNVVVGAALLAPMALRAEARPGVDKDFGPEALRDFHRVIGRPGVDHDDFRAERQGRADRFGDAVSFVARADEHAERDGRGRLGHQNGSFRKPA
jgi:hypothetical protein